MATKRDKHAQAMGRLFARIVAIVIALVFLAACLVPFYYLWLLLKNSMEAMNLKRNLQSLSQDFLLRDTEKEEIRTLKQTHQKITGEIETLERQGDGLGIARNVDGSLSRRTEAGKALATEVAEQYGIKSSIESRLTEHKCTVQERWDELQDAVSNLNTARKNAFSATWALTVWLFVVAVGYIFINTCSIYLDSNTNTLTINGEYVFSSNVSLLGPFGLLVVALLLSLIPCSTLWKSLFMKTELQKPTWVYYDAPQASDLFSISNILNGNRSFAPAILLCIFVIAVSRSRYLLENFTWIATSTLFIIQILLSVRLFRSNKAKGIVAVLLCILTVPITAYLEIQGRESNCTTPTSEKGVTVVGGQSAITNAAALPAPIVSRSFSESTFANGIAARAVRQKAVSPEVSSGARPIPYANSGESRTLNDNGSTTKKGEVDADIEQIVEVRKAIPANVPIVPSPSSELPPPTPGLLLYRVTGIAKNDVLNMRAGPGSNYPLVIGLAPDAIDIAAVGPSQMNGATKWQNIRHNGLTGWVNADFLTGQADNGSALTPNNPSNSESNDQILPDQKSNMNRSDYRNIAPTEPNPNPSVR